MFFDHLDHHRAGDRVTLASLVVVPACASLLTITSHFAQQVSGFAVLEVGLFGVATLADRPANVVARQVAHPEGAHGEAKFLNGFVDLGGGAAFFDQEAGLAAVLLDHAVADEAITHARDHRGLFDLLADGHHGGHDVFAGLGTTHDFQQFHHVGWAEEVHAHHVLWPLGEVGDLVHIQGGGVGGQNRAGLHHFIELLEDGFFDAHFFEHRFDHQVGLTDLVVAQCGAQQSHALVVFLLFELAFFDLRFVVLADGGHTAVQRFLLHLQHLDRDARVQEVHGDAAAHGARANNGHGFDLTLGGIFRHVGNLAGCTVGHKNMAQCTALGREHQVHEDVTLEHHAVFKLLFGGGFNGVHTLDGRGQVFRHAFGHVAGKLEVSIALWVLTRQVTHQRQRAAIGVGCGHFAGQGQRFFSQALRRFGHRIEQFLAGQHGQHFALDGFAADDHVERRLDTDHSGQALRAACAGNQAQLDFGQRHAGAGGCNAVVAAQCQLQTAAHGHRVNGRHNGLGRVFARADDAEQIGFLDRLR